MPLLPVYTERFWMLEGLGSFAQLMADPAQEERFHAYMQVREAAPALTVPAEDRTVPGPHGPVPVRVYRPELPTEGDRPSLVWMHGGAFMAGDLDMPEADRTSREVGARAGAVVVSVDYRLAVGGVHHPVPLDDCVAAVQWVRDHARELGVDPHRITVGGASAGATLATATVLRLRDHDGWQPAGLVTAYGMFHAVLPPQAPERERLLTGVPPLLRFTPESTAAVTVNYLGAPVETADGYAMPALADLTGLCPVLMIDAEYDDLRTSADAFADRLSASGVLVQRHLGLGLMHGCVNLPAEIGPVGDIFALMAQTVASAANTWAT